jgi:hypothetical protein
MAMNTSSPPPLPLNVMCADPSRSISSHSSISVIRQRPAKAREKPGARLVMLSSDQLWHPHQVAGGRGKDEGPIYFGQPPELGLGQSAHTLDPAEDFLDALADALARGIARMPCRAPVDRRAPTAGVLRHVRAHVQPAQFLDKVGGIVTAVGPQRDRARAVGDVLHHVERRQPFGMAGNGSAGHRQSARSGSPSAHGR